MTAADERTTRRPYHAPQRLAGALETRQRIIDAARELFLADGYAATAVRTVARSAGVAEKTVYLQFDTKSALLKAVVETAIVGDDEAVPAAERDWFLDVVAQTSLEPKLQRLVAATSALHERTGAIFMMARGAAAVDAEAAGLWAFGKQGHRADMTILANSFQAVGLLPPGLTVGWLTDLLYVLIGPETWQLGRVELEQNEQDYVAWLYASLYRTLGGSLAQDGDDVHREDTPVGDCADGNPVTREVGGSA